MATTKAKATKKTTKKTSGAETPTVELNGSPTAPEAKAKPVYPTFDDALGKMSAELQALQRQRAVILKSRNMQSNRLQAVVAGTLGYHSGMEEKARTTKFAEASALIKAVVSGENTTHPMRSVIRTTMIGITAFNDYKDELEKEMVTLAKKLPVANWIVEKNQRGFGLLFLAIVIGETGDLRTYTTPGKLWRRLGCAPWTFGGKTAMGATWRSGREGKLPAEEWEKFGYSPRRRSIAYLIGEGLMKQNLITKKGEDADGEITKEVLWTGPYRARYNDARVTFAKSHPDYTPKRVQLHGMLVATKLLLRYLWRQWNGMPINPPGEWVKPGE